MTGGWGEVDDISWNYISPRGSPLSFLNATQHGQKFYTQIQHSHRMDKFHSPKYNIHIDLEEREPPLIFERHTAWAKILHLNTTFTQNGQIAFTQIQHSTASTKFLHPNTTLTLTLKKESPLSFLKALQDGLHSNHQINFDHFVFSN